jgi:glucose-6-phosphate dehydrogenase assembly protein OpcA
MATTTYKVLGQTAPAATTETDLYTVPTSTQAIVSTIVVANRATSSSTFRISSSVAGAATATKDYLAYDVSIPAGSFLTMTLGITLGAADKLRVYASSANLSFNAYGTQVA